MRSEFISRMSSFGGGPDRTNMFMVEFFPTSNAIQYEGNLRFFCKSVEVPGTSFLTKQVRPTSYGHAYTMPYGIQPHDVNCVFILDANNKIMTWFKTWMKKVVNFDPGDGPHSQDGHLTPSEVGYLRGPEGYGMNVTITKFSPYDSSVRYVTELRDVYPTSLGSTTLSWDENNTVALLPVTFAYSTKTSPKHSESTTDGEFNRGQGEIRHLPTIGGRGQTIHDNIQRIYSDEL